MAIVLALDPGLAHLGHAVIRARRGMTPEFITGGAFTTERLSKKTNVKASGDYLRRVEELSRFVDETCELFAVDAICYEGISLGMQHAVTQLMQGLAYGALGAIIARRRLPTMEVSPFEWHKAVAGNARATVSDCWRAIEPRIKGIELPKRKGDHEHLIDALGVFLACENSPVMRAMLDVPERMAARVDAMPERQRLPERSGFGCATGVRAPLPTPHPPGPGDLCPTCVVQGRPPHTRGACPHHPEAA